jgi:hypothetical protein
MILCIITSLMLLLLRTELVSKLPVTDTASQRASTHHITVPQISHASHSYEISLSIECIDPPLIHPLHVLLLPFALVAFSNFALHNT